MREGSLRMSGTPRGLSMGSSMLSTGASFNLRSWVRDRFVPVVMVLSSKEAEEICRGKNGLTLVDVLRTFGNVPRVNYPLRIGDQNIRLRQLKLRFHYASSIDQPTAEVLDTHLKNIVSSTVDSELKKLPGTLEECQEQEGDVDLAPWFKEYRDEFLDLLCFDTHETFDHPVGCIFVISSAEIDPIAALEKLKTGNPWPHLMSQGYMFPVHEEDFAKFIIVLHDGSVGGPSEIQSAEAKVGALKRAYGSSCSLLVINTTGGNADLRGQPPQPYESCRARPIPGGGAGREAEIPDAPPEGVGSWLSHEDLDRIQECVGTFASRCLLPKIDVRIGKMSSILPLKKRTFAKLMDRTSSYLKMNFSGVTKDYATSIGYKYYTAEAQARQMGDILFLLQRYEDALDAYSSVTVSKEQFPKFFAGIQEMIGLCHAMIVAFGNPPHYFSKAFEYYQRVPGKISRMLSTRCAIMHAAYNTSVGQLLSANQVLMQAYEGEEMLRGALLLEQAALSLLFCVPPVPRKFAFQMTLAGVWYYNSMFKALSLRCYQLVVGVYKGREWVSLEEHIGDMMLRFALEQGQFESAVGWTQQMLSPNNNLSVETQQQYLKSLSNFVVSHDSNSQAQMLLLDIPVVSMEDLHIESDGEYVVGSNEAHGAPSSIWEQLEQCFNEPLGSSGTVSGLDSVVIPLENHRMVVCGEEIGVLCHFRNPLKLGIKVDAVKLQYEYEWAEGASGANPVSVVDEKFMLQGEETAIIRLSVHVSAPGRLKVTGVEWKLNENIPGEKRFSSFESNHTNGLPFRAKGHNPCLFFLIIPPVPRLEAVACPLPDDLWVGEIYNGLWQLKNSGSVGLKNLQVVISSTDAMFCQIPSQENGKVSVMQLETLRKKRFPTFILESKKGVQGGSSVSCPIWLHPSTPGNQVIHCLFRYESEEQSAFLRWRFLRYSFGLKVLAPLKLAHKTNPAPGLSPAYLMTVQVGNEHAISDVQLESAVCLTNRWGVQLCSQPKLAMSEGSTQLDQKIPRKKRAHIQLLLTPPAKQGHSLHEEGSQNTQESNDSVVQLLHMQRLAASTECSTSEEDTLALCMHWSALHTGMQTNTRSQSSKRQGVLYCTQSMKDILQPIHIAAKGLFQITHQFRSSPVCVVPISLVIKNTALSPASLRVEAGNQFEDHGGGWHIDIVPDGQELSPGRKTQMGAGLSPSKQVMWFGQIRKGIPVLEPGGSVAIPMAVAVFKSGRYCVTDYLCQWTIEGSPARHGVIAGPPIMLSVAE